MPKKYIPTEQEIQRQLNVMARDFHPDELAKMGGKESLRKAAITALTARNNRKRLNTSRNHTARKSGLMELIEDENTQ